MPAESALHSAARRLMRCAYSGAIGSRPKVCPMRTKSGFPGGCGSPRTFTAAMYSLASHIAVVGASVTT